MLGAPTSCHQFFHSAAILNANNHAGIPDALAEKDFFASPDRLASHA
jgi:hypothetical protein